MQLYKSTNSVSNQKIIFAKAPLNNCKLHTENYLMVSLLISLVLLIPYVVLIIYYRQSWQQLKIYFPEKGFNPITTISIIIPARNEEKNIGLCLKSIVQQTYPKDLFEVIIVDDHSVDDTAGIARSFHQSNIRVVSLNETLGNTVLNSYKKKAVEIAIAVSKGNLIITTDADCIAQPRWVETIASCYEKKKAVFIVAPVVYEKPLTTDSFLRKFIKIFQSLDFIMLQGITGASVYKRIHNMCNGANLAYEKKAFYEVGGFEGIDNIASGDDMLLMHKIQKIYPDKTVYLKSQDAIVTTKPTETLREFMNQRIRWASKADKYPDFKIIAVLVFVYFFNAWIFFLAIASFSNLNALFLLTLLLSIKICVELFFLFPVAKFFRTKKILWWFIPSQPFHIIYMLIAGWLGKFGSYTWKDRKVK